MLFALLVIIVSIKHLHFSTIFEEQYDFSEFENEIAQLQIKSQYFKKTKSSNYIQSSFESAVVKEIERQSIDLNIADTLTLKKLKGVGSIFSNRIIKYRDLLGGFSNKSQLLEVYGIDSSLYQKLSPYVYVDHKSLKKINLNYASVDQLKAHPYLGYKESNAIVKYRI